MIPTKLYSTFIFNKILFSFILKISFLYISNSSNYINVQYIKVKILYMNLSNKKISGVYEDVKRKC